MNDKRMNKILENDYIDNLMDKKMSRGQKAFWYITGSAEDRHGRMRVFLLGPYGDSNQARGIAESKRLTSFEVVELSTSDLSKAGQVMKARRLKGNSSMSDVFERVQHRNVGGKDL